MASSSTARTLPTAKLPRQNPGPACQQCRWKKLRCDRQRPCAGCVDSGVECQVSSTPPQRGPQKGHLKAIRSRLTALEARLGAPNIVTGDGASSPGDVGCHMDMSGEYDWELGIMDISLPQYESGNGSVVTSLPVPPTSSVRPQSSAVIMQAVPEKEFISTFTRADLDQLYFDRTHVFAPLIQQYRYFHQHRSSAASPLVSCPSEAATPPSPLPLQCAMWTMAAALSSQFQHLREQLYQDTLERLHKGPTEHESSMLEHSQAWILVSIYEFMQGTFKRAWISSGRAIRLVQLMRLSETDDISGLDVVVDGPSFVAMEEKRRTFWMAFCLDRFGSILYGLPLTLNDQPNSPRLPCSEDAFQSGSPVLMPFLSNVVNGTDPAMLSHFAECIVFSHLWGQVYQQHKQSSVEYNNGKISPDFRDRHSRLDELVSLRISQMQRNLGTSVQFDPMQIFTSMIAQTTTLLLCQVAEFIPIVAADDREILVRYQQRASAAVKEIAHLAGYVLHSSFFKIHPFAPVPLYLCRHSLQILKLQDSTLEDNLEVISRALQELQGINGLGDVDLSVSHTTNLNMQEVSEAEMGETFGMFTSDSIFGEPSNNHEERGDRITHSES
ncbi:fungal-specific transcription factor domain-containing protein [Xylaria scruposa]|nr:fungal-specific transcription factor domain-containing protein [Xylaria scruposa]